MSMKAKVLLSAVGLAVAGLVTAVVLFSDSSKVADSAPQGVERESASPRAPAVALAPPVATPETPAPGAAEVQAAPVATEVRSEVGAPVIRGRVVEADGGLPRTGIELQLKSLSDVIASTLSDGAGRFELPYSNVKHLAVELVEPEGWKAVRRRQRVSDSGPPTVDLVFELRRDARVVFHGRAVDEASGEPLPSLRLSVGSDFTSTGVETDGEGLFTSRQRYKAGPVQITLITVDGARWTNSERTIDFDGTSRIHEVPLPIGPTYDLRVSAPPGYTLADLRAFLADSSHGCPWTLTDDLRKGETLHLSSPPWVRFLQVGDVPEGELATLWICTADGRWLGPCKVPPSSRRGNGVHEVTLVPCGSVEVALRGDAPGIGPNVIAELRLPDGEECWGRRPNPEEDGRRRFRLVPPGDYVLSIEGNRTKTIERAVRVAAGEPTIVELELEFLEEGGSVTGVVRSQSGQYQTIDLVRLKALRRKTEDFTTEVQWTNAVGELVGRFTFEDVPAGEYELSPAGSSNFDWRTSMTTVSPPAADVELLCLDGAGGIRLEVEAFDATTGKPVRELAVYVNRKGVRHPDSYSINSNRLQLGRFPRDVSLEWGAVCTGYAARGGDLSSFEPVGTEEGEPLLRARLELQPGWGGRVLAYTETERIPDAAVLCDDIEVGRTNKRGELDIVLHARPKRFEVRHPGFVMEYPTTGDLPDDAAVLLCYMKPSE